MTLSALQSLVPSQSVAVPTTVRVYIVAEFGPLRMGLSQAVGEAHDMSAVGDAVTLDQMSQDPSLDSADVVLVEASAVDGMPPHVYQRLEARLPSLKVLFLGTRQEGATISFDTLKAVIGLHTAGFVYKEGSTERLLQAIRLVAATAFVCETQVIRRILGRLTEWATYSAPEPGNQLSEREREVLELVVRGNSNKAIARHLFVSEGTVKSHVSHILNKLGLERRTEIVRYVLSNGLLSDDSGPERGVAPGLDLLNFGLAEYGKTG